MKMLAHIFAVVLGLALAPALLRAQHEPAVPVSGGGSATTHAEPGTEPSQFSLLTDRDISVSLDGLWRFHPGDDPRWADPSYNDAEWPLIGSRDSWDEAGYSGLSGMAWYRFRVVLPAGAENYSLRLPQIPTCYQVFVDGELLRTVGKLPPNPVMYRTQPLLVDLPPERRLTPQTAVVAIRIWQSPEWANYMLGGLHGPIVFGRSDILHARFDKEEAARLWSYSDWVDLGVLEMLASMVAFALFLSRRREVEYLWFGLLTLGLGANHITRVWTSLNVNPVKAFEAVEGFFFAIFLAASLLFFRSFLGGRWTIVFRGALACAGLWYLSTVMIGPGLLTVLTENMYELAFTLPVYLWIIFFIRRRASLGQQDAKLLLFPVILLFGSLFYRQTIWTLQTAGMPLVDTLYLTVHKPFYLTLEDVAEAIFLLAILGIVLHRFARTRQEQDRLSSELEAARSVQQVLVPESLPCVNGLRIAMAYHPALEVGGDFFQILPLHSGETLLVIGDVAGKGLPAALTVSLAVGTVRTLADYQSSPAEILCSLNRRMQNRGPGFTTCLAMRFSVDRSVLTIANAGHLSPYLNGEELPTEPHLPLGLDPDANFAEMRFSLKPGDHLVVLTDGVPEAQSQGELFGFERTLMMSRESAARIAEAARLFGQTDDITVLTVDVDPGICAPESVVLSELQPA